MASLAVLVLLFIRTDCPIANRYAPELERLHALYAPKGIEFRLIYAEPNLTPAQIEQVKVGTLVATRTGWRRVTASGMTGHLPIGTVHLTNGRSLTPAPARVREQHQHRDPV